MKAWLLAASLVSIWPVAHAQVVQWDLESRQANPHLVTRSDSSTLQETIANNKRKGGYFANVKVGSPGQNVTLQLDTGSSDVWMPYSDAPICKKTGCQLGSFDPNNSSSFEDIGSNLFSITYVDDSYARGDYFTDDFTMGDIEVKNLTMGLALTTTISYGLMGIGYTVNEASVDTIDKTYPNLPVAMYQAGYINTIAYSLWLNDLDASTGNILFGGIDTKKYTGNLTRVDVIANHGTYDHFKVAVNSITATSPSGTDKLSPDSLPFEAVLDSGTTLTYIPNRLASQMWDEVGAIYEPDWGLAVLPCSFAQHDGNFTFGFGSRGGPEIVVGMDELVVDLTNGNQPTFSEGEYKGQKVCEFGIQNYTSSEVYLLGATFLRSAYVVYDLVNNEVGLAQANFNTKESNIVAFKSKGATIPSATAAPNQNQTQSTPTSTSTSTSTDLSAADGFQNETDDNNGSTVNAPGSSLMVVGITIAFMLVGSGAFPSNFF
ncbi:aspartic peptidase domain-containing protein [Thelonectria olida]|uniref:Probable aspartic-type endopeptidase OPSB n=1 Tax=Thelonectria olida TaxID=1576542 RepID=A0A9P8W0X5_9HYPO|nr:aspartic peptidase domain-containing protein [Thelonectria olida]